MGSTIVIGALMLAILWLWERCDKWLVAIAFAIVGMGTVGMAAAILFNWPMISFALKAML